MYVLDLFSGIGGFALGLEAAGMRTIGFCEIEPFPRAVLAHHWPGVPIHDDVRTLSVHSVSWLRAEAERGIDLVCGGFPCQDISVAGKGAGLAGSRSGLWSEFARLVGELGPGWVLAENVGALRTRGMDRVCSDLEAAGYAVWPLLVGAWAVGAPHKRERVWIVAHCNTEGAGRVTGIMGAPTRQGKGEGIQRERHRAASGHGGPEDRAVGLADRHGRGREGEREPREDTTSVEGRDGARRDDAHGRGERPVGSPTGAGLEGHGADAGEPAQLQPRFANPRWPARPGEPQHEWEEPRLVHSIDRGRRESLDARGSGPSCGAAWQISGADGAEHSSPPRDSDPGSPELPLGFAVDGLPVRLARRANREALRALGNSVVPQVVYAIGRAILAADEELT